MSAAAQELLTAFDALPDADRDAVVTELLVRRPVGTGACPTRPSRSFPGNLFAAYDAEEAAPDSSDFQVSRTGQPHATTTADGTRRGEVSA